MFDAVEIGAACHFRGACFLFEIGIVAWDVDEKDANRGEIIIAACAELENERGQEKPDCMNIRVPYLITGS